jgi:hypothetical protein
MLQKHFFLNKIIGQITVFDGKKNPVHPPKSWSNPSVSTKLDGWIPILPFFFTKKTRKGGAPKLYVGSYNPHTIDIP